MDRLNTQNKRLSSRFSIHSTVSPQTILPQTQNANQIIRLNNTLFSRENAIRFTAGTRPYREAGIRMQKQLLDGKTIYHNYGHGGGGLSVGYGCVYQVVQNLFEANRVSTTQSVAVLGAGIIGLTTAYILALKGINVNLYAEIYPFIQEQGKPELTTTVAGGYWMPLKLGNKEQTKKVAKLTWDHYHDLMTVQQQTGQNLGVTKLPTYCVNDDQGLTYFQIEGVIHPKKVQVCFQNGVPFQAVTFPSLVIESSKYLPYLIQKMKESGKVKFHKEIVTRESLNIKVQKHIFNCCGLNGADFCGDTSKNKGIKGHVWHFNLSKHKQVADYILFLKTKQGRWILQVPHLNSNKLILGISYEDGKKDSFPQVQQANKIIQTAQNFYKTVVLTNKVKQNASL